MRAQNRTSPSFTKTRVGIRGKRRRSDTANTSVLETPKILLEYPINRRRTALLLSFLDVLPLHFRKLFDQLLQFLVVGHSLPYPLFPGARDVKLTEFAAPALHEIEGDVKLPLGTTTPGLATPTAADCQGPPQEVPEMNHLSRTRAEAAFWSIHRDSAHKLLLCNNNVISDLGIRQLKLLNANMLQESKKEAKILRIIKLAAILRNQCGIADCHQGPSLRRPRVINTQGPGGLPIR